MLANGSLQPTRHPGVFRAQGAPNGGDCHTWAAVLASRAVLSHQSAAQWWNLPVAGDGLIHVTRYDRRRFAPPAGVRVHRTHLARRAVTDAFGMPITTRDETLLDCLGRLEDDAARTLFDRAMQQRWITPAEVEHRLEDQPGRWGNAALKRLLQQSRPGAESEAERRLQRALRQAGMTGWHANLAMRVNGRTVRIDVAFPDSRLAVEVDGWAFHRSKERQTADMAKSNALMAAGWRVLRFSWEDVHFRPDHVIATITALLTSFGLE